MISTVYCSSRCWVECGAGWYPGHDDDTRTSHTASRWHYGIAWCRWLPWQCMRVKGCHKDCALYTPSSSTKLPLLTNHITVVLDSLRRYLPWSTLRLFRCTLIAFSVSCLRQQLVEALCFRIVRPVVFPSVNLPQIFTVSVGKTEKGFQSVGLKSRSKVIQNPRIDLNLRSFGTHVSVSTYLYKCVNATWRRPTLRRCGVESHYLW